MIFFPALGTAGADSGARAAGSCSSMGTSLIPQMGQSPGLSEIIVGCMGQWYRACAAGAVCEAPPAGSDSPFPPPEQPARGAIRRAAAHGTSHENETRRLAQC